MNRDEVLNVLRAQSDILGVQFYIENLLGRPVDLVTDKALREEMRPYIEREMVNV